METQPGTVGLRDLTAITVSEQRLSSEDETFDFRGLSFENTPRLVGCLVSQSVGGGEYE